MADKMTVKLKDAKVTISRIVEIANMIKKETGDIFESKEEKAWLKQQAFLLEEGEKKLKDAKGQGDEFLIKMCKRSLEGLAYKLEVGTEVQQLWEKQGVWQKVKDGLKTVAKFLISAALAGV